MDNEQYIAALMKMTADELLDQIMESPEYLTDPYYREFRSAFYARYNQLKTTPTEGNTV